MDYNNHPCFSKDAKHRYGRIHLPVAPKCNIQCNYCNRDYSCINESRPGVSASVLTPAQAVCYLDDVMHKMSNISVIGIAGPGDPFANGMETMETLRLVRERHPDAMLCLASNGLEIEEYIDELRELNVSHVTVTVNAVDPEVSRAVYAWVRLKSRIYRGADAAAVLLERQLDAIKKLKSAGIVVKINTVIMPGINDTHAVDVARTMAALQADIMNCIPLYHVAETPLAGIEPPDAERMDALREDVKKYIPVMTHCSRCRADAAGLIGEEQSREVMELLQKASRPKVTKERPYVAVASMEGIFVNQHLGETSQLWIYEMNDGVASLVECRLAPPSGIGTERWVEMAKILHDCNTILVSGIGPSPKAILETAGFYVVIMEGLAEEGVRAVLSGKQIPLILLRSSGLSRIGKECGGNGMGCG